MSIIDKGAIMCRLVIECDCWYDTLTYLHADESRMTSGLTDRNTPSSMERTGDRVLLMMMMMMMIVVNNGGDDSSDDEWCLWYWSSDNVYSINI